VATGLVVLAGVMTVAAGLGIYLNFRNSTPNPGSTWIPTGVDIPNAPLVMAVVTAVLSSITAQWVVHASRSRDRGHTFLAVGVTLVFGLAYLNMILASVNMAGIPVGSTAWANMALSLTGLVLVFGVIGLVYLALMAVRAMGGEEGDDGSAPIAAAVVFWHFCVAAWIAVWYVVYVVK
jgi:heme/copper-type cytochrome/quinol oxidase subunit 3